MGRIEQIWQSYCGFIDRHFAPRQSDDIHVLLRIRVAVTACWLKSALLLVWFIPVLYLVQPDFTEARKAAFAVILLSLGAPWLTLINKSGRLLVNVMIVTNLGAVLFTSFQHGGLDSPSLPFLLTAPALAILIGPRSAIGVMLGCASWLGFLQIAQAHGWTGPLSYPGEDVALVRAVAVGTVSLSITAFLLVFYAHHATITSMLERANAAALSASESKSRFLANMSHEVRTPLNGIMTILNLLQQDDLTPSQHHRVQVANKSAQGLLEIINDILDFSKLESGSLKIENTDFDFDDLINSVYEILSESAAAKGLKLRVSRAGRQPRWLVGDPLRIRQILFNLIGNAIKFTDRGTVTLTISNCTVSRATSAHRGDMRLRFAVRDTGMGIPEAEIDRVFDRFHQPPSGSGANIAGTGLGLAICRELIDLMGGDIHVSSTPGKGTCFWFELPFGEGQPMKEATGEIETASSPPLNILVAEDHPTNRFVLRLLLEQAGHRLKIVENGEEAVAAAASEKFDVILMDDLMPGLNGREAAGRIRAADSGNASVPIIGLTANAARDDEKYLAAGMDRVLAKPIQPEKLLTALQDLTGTDAI